MSFPNVFSILLLLLSKLFILSFSLSPSLFFPLGEDDISLHETLVCLHQSLQAVGSKAFNYNAI